MVIQPCLCVCRGVGRGWSETPKDRLSHNETLFIHSLDTGWLSTAVIIGMVIGGVIFVTVVVGVVVALVCGCNKTRGQGGNIVYPSSSAPGRPRETIVPH